MPSLPFKTTHDRKRLVGKSVVIVSATGVRRPAQVVGAGGRELQIVMDGNSSWLNVRHIYQIESAP